MVNQQNPGINSTSKDIFRRLYCKIPKIVRKYPDTVVFGGLFVIISGLALANNWGHVRTDPSRIFGDYEEFRITYEIPKNFSFSNDNTLSKYSEHPQVFSGYQVVPTLPIEIGSDGLEPNTNIPIYKTPQEALKDTKKDLSQF